MVEPLNKGHIGTSHSVYDKGHIGTSHSVHYREVVLFLMYSGTSE